MSGQIVDASLVAAPRQRNTDDEKKAIKEGRIPPNWKAKPAKLRHKDRDARWTVKFTKAKPREDGSMPPVDLAIPLFGYQNHVSIDRRFGFIRDWGLSVLNASERRDLLEILDDRHGRASTIVTSQIPVEHWHNIIGDPTLGDAILDRLVHNAHRLQLTGESMRKQNARNQTLDAVPNA